MSDNYMSYEAFCTANKHMIVAKVKPYGIYHKGQAYWASKLPRRNTMVKYIEDHTTPMLSLIIFDLDGSFRCNAWPPAWHERDHECFRVIDNRPYLCHSRENGNPGKE